MTDSELSLENSLSDCETIIRQEMFFGIINLITNNPFKERIIFLLNNQNFSRTKIKSPRGIVSCPNCIGTALFTAGITSLDFPFHGYEEYLYPHMRDETNKPFSGTFIFSYWAEGDNWHAGIYLGNIGENDISFAQHGHGGRFGPESLSCNYCNPSFYIPRTLMVKK